MGCCTVRPQTELDVEETVISPFEARLELKQIHFSKLLNRFQEYSEKGYISYYEISKVFAELKLPFQEIFEFYKQFDRTKSRVISYKRFSYLQLQSFALVMCKGDRKSKLNDWFNLYGNGKDKIESTTLEEMIENLLKPVIDYICDFTRNTNKDNHVLLRYCKFVKTGKDSLIEYLSRSILGRKNTLSKSEFISNCTNTHMIDIFFPTNLRDKSYYFGINGGLTGSDPQLQVKSKMQILSFNSLSDVSSQFDRENKLSPPATSKRPSMLSDSGGSKRSFKYSFIPAKKLRDLKIEDNGDNQEAKKPIKRSNNVIQKSFESDLFLSALPSEKKGSLKRRSHHLTPPRSSIGRDGGITKRYSNIIASNEV